MASASADHQRGAAATIWVPSFDGVRGFVSISILLVHVQLAVGWRPQHEFLRALRSSWFYSIEFLFLVGGFVALLPVVAYGGFLGRRRYAIRRAGRLLPLYWLTIALSVALGGLLRPVSGIDHPHDLGAVLVHLTFLQHLVLPFREGFGVHGIVWTQTLVACFYVVFALTASWYARRPVLGLVAALGIAVAARTQIPILSRWYLEFPLFLSDFAIGMTAAWAYVSLRRSGRRLSPRVATFCAVGALAAMVGLMYATGLPITRRENAFYYNEGVFLSIATPLAFACFMVALAYTPRWFQWPAANPVSRKLGDISYGLFMFHFLAIWLVLRYVHIPRNGSLSSLVFLTLLVFPITVTAAWLGTRFVERPLRERAQAFAERFRRQPGTPEGASSPEPRPTPDPAPVPTS
jgi:peptidoglycan/LPS O-acetylase OafA/YrhL